MGVAVQTLLAALSSLLGNRESFLSLHAYERCMRTLAAGKMYLSRPGAC